MVSDATGEQNLLDLILLIKLLKQSKEGSSLLVSSLICQKRLTRTIYKILIRKLEHYGIRGIAKKMV